MKRVASKTSKASRRKRRVYPSIRIHSIRGWGDPSSEKPGLPDTGFVIQWAADGIGFGELEISVHEGADGQEQFHVEAEGMSREFIQAVLAVLGKQLVLK